MAYGTPDRNIKNYYRQIYGDQLRPCEDEAIDNIDARIVIKKLIKFFGGIIKESEYAGNNNPEQTDIVTRDWYKLLVDDCKAIVTEAVFNSRWALVEGYHMLGERIVTEHNLDRREIYGKKIAQGLAQSIGLSERTINYAVQFM